MRKHTATPSRSLGRSRQPRNQYGGPLEGADPHATERFVRVRQGEGRRKCPDRCFLSDGEELLSILPSQIRDGSHPPLLPQPFVRKGGNVAHVDPGAHDDSRLVGGGERRRDESPDGSEDQRGVQRLGRAFVRTPGPVGAEAEREFLSGAVTGPREGKDPTAAMSSDLDRNVRGGAEAVETDTPGLAGETKGAVADHAGAQERGGLYFGVARGKREDIALVRDRVVGVPAVYGVPGEQGPIAQVLASRTAVRTLPARPAEPGHAHAVPRTMTMRRGTHLCHGTHDLVPGHERKSGGGELAVDNVDICAAHPAGRDANLYLGFGGLGRFLLDQLERLLRSS